MPEHLNKELSDLIKKLNRSINIMAVLIAIFLVIYIASLPVRYYLQQKNIDNALGQGGPVPIWVQIQNAKDSCDYEEEERLVLELLKMEPYNVTLHTYLAEFYFARRDLVQAEKHMNRAYELAPLEEHAMHLSVLRMLIEKEKASGS